MVFTSRSYMVLVRSYGLRQEFITPNLLEQNGMVVGADVILAHPAEVKVTHLGEDGGF